MKWTLKEVNEHMYIIDRRAGSTGCPLWGLSEVLSVKTLQALSRLPESPSRAV